MPPPSTTKATASPGSHLSSKQEPKEIQTPHAIVNDDRPHVHVIPRPPEWDVQPPSDDQESGDSADDSDSDTSSTSQEDHADNNKLREQDVSRTPAERGILLSFPNLEFHGMELLTTGAQHLFADVRFEVFKENYQIQPFQLT